MSRDRRDAEILAAWRANRAHLVDLAFRMLGDIGEAEDVVQEAFSRLSVAELDTIEDQRGWLTVVASRLCLDRIRSARSRRERPEDFLAAEPLTGVGSPRPTVDPLDRVTLDDSVRLALLLVMERLTPAERVVFVLHDVFGMPFEEIAQTVGRPTATCRQLAHRARQKLEAGSASRRFDIASSEHRAVTERFIAACATGDVDSLLAALDPDVSGEVVLGTAPSPGVVHGADQVAANLLRHWGAPATLVSVPGGGDPVLLAFRAGRLAGVITLRLATDDSDRVAKVHVTVDPVTLGSLRAQLVGSTP